MPPGALGKLQQMRWVSFLLCPEPTQGSLQPCWTAPLHTTAAHCVSAPQGGLLNSGSFLSLSTGWSGSSGVGIMPERGSPHQGGMQVGGKVLPWVLWRPPRVPAGPSPGCPEWWTLFLSGLTPLPASWDELLNPSHCLTVLRGNFKSEASLVAQTVKRLPAMQETQVRFLGREDPLEKEMGTHSNTLA